IATPELQPETGATGRAGWHYGSLRLAATTIGRQDYALSQPSVCQREQCRNLARLCVNSRPLECQHQSGNQSGKSGLLLDAGSEKIFGGAAVSQSERRPTSRFLRFITCR